MAENIKVAKGLVGVITDETSVSKVMAETNSLTYRGKKLDRGIYKFSIRN